MLDTHCHIDLYKNPISVLDTCEKNKIIVFSMTNLPSHFEMGLPFFKSKKFARISLGMHPLYAKFHENEFEKFEKNLNKTSYIGEIGLDFSNQGISTKSIQIKSFEKILSLVSQKKKILSIHSRKAENEVLEYLLKYKIKYAIFHWYSGGINAIKEISEAGFYFSINPAMIKSISGQKIISKIPKDRLLTETDGPFIENVDRPFYPGEIESVIKYLANYHKMSEFDLVIQIKNNFNKLLEGIR